MSKCAKSQAWNLKLKNNTIDKYDIKNQTCQQSLLSSVVEARTCNRMIAGSSPGIDKDNFFFEIDKEILTISEVH